MAGGCTVQTVGHRFMMMKQQFYPKKQCFAPSVQKIGARKMKIEDLKVGRVYRAKRPRGVHRLDGSYVNDRQILYISPFGESIQYDSPSVTFNAKYPIISTEKFLKWADKDITDSLPPNE